MFDLKKIVTGLVTGIVLSLGSIAPAMADDAEIYLNNAPTAGVRPNVLLIVDTSRSMEAADSHNERQPEYNPNGTYTRPGNCTDGRIFFRRKGEPQPTCASTNYITTTSNNCSKLAAATAIGATGGRSGRWTGKAAQWDTVSNTWTDLVPSGTANPVECAADSGNHGSNAASTPNVFARNGDTANKWTSLTASGIEWGQRTTYTFYSAKYLAWYTNTPANVTVTRIQAVENAVANLVSSTDGINMGMMRFNTRVDLAGVDDQSDREYRGGMVTNAIQNIETNRAALITAITNTGTGFGVCNTDPEENIDSPGYCPNTGTMSSETSWEAHQYWTGGTMWSGNVAGRDPSFTTTTYTSPITSQCQKNYQILLTDGRPSVDNEADDLIRAKNGGVACTGNPGTGGSTAGRCLDELAGYMNRSTTDLAPSVPGNQQVITHTIAFGQDVTGAEFLTEVAEAGGGRRFNASNSSDLQDIFDEITGDVLDVATTFSTASVSVNAFNRTSSRNELYFALFAPEARARWDGNLKKFKLAVIDPDDSTGPLPPKIIVTGQGAVEDAIAENGRFKPTTQSFWSAADDGDVVTDGGAANKLPVYTSRVIKTHLGTNPLTPITDAAVTAGMLGAANATERTEVLDFIRARNEKRMGDPMHSVPQVVTYGGTAENPIDVVYVATNDGVLHAINAADNSGAEMWAFMPRELLSRQKNLMDNPAASTRTYGLDGDIRVLRYDIDSDGTIESAQGDRVYLYVGMRRGGRFYYALDVTDRTNPSLLWKLGPDQLPSVGETWSPPTIARVNINGATQNGQRFVLIFGGGYDDKQEDYLQVDDTRGNRIYMVDAKSGALLWWAGKAVTGETPNLALPAMSNSIPSKITVLDMDGDQLADRMYAADTGGRVFRFDIANGNPVSTLVTGGVFASLGQGAFAGGSVSPAAIADTRRFYNAPDVSLIQSRGASTYLSVSIGSGYRGHPLHRATVDRFYVMRDWRPYARLANADYTAATVIEEGDLHNITADPANANVPADGMGWRYVFSANPGEKVLSEATTAGGVVMFTTYQPLDPNPAVNSCLPQHRNRVYAINIGNGRPALDLDGSNGTGSGSSSNNLTNADLFEVINHDGILGGVNIAVLRGDLMEEFKRQCEAHESNPCDQDDEAELTCITGMHVMDRCVPVGDGGRNYWRKRADSGS